MVAVETAEVRVVVVTAAVTAAVVRAAATGRSRARKRRRCTGPPSPARAASACSASSANSSRQESAQPSANSIVVQLTETTSAQAARGFWQYVLEPGSRTVVITPKLGARLRAAAACPQASPRPCVTCEWMIPASLCCSPSCGSSSRTWGRAPRRSARR
eukprot:scaffold98796_cov63-Phaeocystis_antarctica.AAC.3